MKKLLKFISCLGLCLSLVACSESQKVDDAALDEVVAAIEKMAELDSASYEINADITANGEQVQAKIAGGFMNTGNSPLVSMVMDMNSAEGNLAKFIEFYMTEDANYVSFMGMKQKTPLDENVEEIGNIIESSGDTGFDKELLKPYLKSATKSGDKVSIVIDMDKVAEVDGAKESMGTASFEEFSMDITITDGYATSITFTCKATDSKTKTAVEFVANADIKDINKVTSIDFPDFSDYTESGLTDF